MKIKITLTAHGVDSIVSVSSVAAAQSVVTAFAAGIGQPPHFNPHALRERKAAKMDYMMRNAQWFAEIIG